jgi:hypothetical protein
MRFYEDPNTVQVSPFTGGPATTMSGDTVQVELCELTPEGAQRADGLGAFAGFILLVVTLCMLSQGPVFLAPFLGALLVPPLVSGWTRRALRRAVHVVFTPTEFKVKRKGKWYVYNRSIDHSFMVLEHDRARYEREALDVLARREQSKGTFKVYTRYYGEAAHVCLNYYGQRHDLIDVYDKRRAQAVAARLQACDRLMDNYAKSGQRRGLDVEDEWAAQPGGLNGQQR